MDRSWIILTVACVLAGAGAAGAHEAIPAEFATQDGVKIVGDYWTPIDMSQPAPVVVLLHMYRSDRRAWQPLVPALEEAGFAILAIDLRGHGESTEAAEEEKGQKGSRDRGIEGSRERGEARRQEGTKGDLAARARERDASLFNAMHKDVAAAYVWLSKRKEADLSRFAIVGASVGCSVALDYASRDKSVDACVLLTPGTDYLGVDSLSDIAAYGARHLLLLSSEEEKDRGPLELYEKANAVGVLANMEAYPRSGIHGTRMFGVVKGVEQRIAAFLKKAVNENQGTKAYGALGGTKFYMKDHPEVERIDSAALRVYSSTVEASKRGLGAGR